MKHDDFRALERHTERLRKLEEKEGKKSAVDVIAGFFTAIFKYWPITLLIIVIILSVITYLLISSNESVETLASMYDSVNTQTTNSKHNFNKKLQLVTLDENGKPIFQSDDTLDTSTEKDNEEDDGSDIETNSGSDWDGEGIAIKASQIFNKMSYQGKGKAVSNLPVNDLNVYTGIPWKDDGNWYEYNIEVANSYLTKNLGQGFKEHSQFAKDNNNGSTGVTRNGVLCMPIAWYPIFAFCDTKEDGSFSPAWTKGRADMFYGCAKIEKSGKEYYLPIAPGEDNKGHTWPGGLVQTSVGHDTRLDTRTNMLTIDSGGAADIANCKWGDVQAHGLTMSLEEFRRDWKTKMYYLGQMGLYHPTLGIEANSAYTFILGETYGFEIKAFYVHKPEGV